MEGEEAIHKEGGNFPDLTKYILKKVAYVEKYILYTINSSLGEKIM